MTFGEVGAGARPPEAEAVVEQAWGALAPMRDPFGYGFRLIAFKGAGYDAVEVPSSRMSHS